MSHDTGPASSLKPEIKTGMEFTNDANLGGFSYRVITVLEGDQYDVDVKPWGLALEKNDPGVLRMRGEIIRKILGH